MKKGMLLLNYIQKLIVLCHTLFLLALIATNHHDFSSFPVDCCMFVAVSGKMAQKSDSLANFLCEKWANTMNSPFLTPKYTPCLLLPMEVERVRDQNWQEQSSPIFLPGVSKSEFSVSNELR